MGKARARIASQVYAVLASDADFPSGRINPTALTVANYRFRPVNLPSQSKVNGDLIAQPPGVLPKEEKAWLSLASSGGDAHVALEEANVTEKK